MRALRLLLAGVLGALSLVVLTTSPSFACSCVQASPAEHVDAADVVVLGTVVDRQGPPLRPVMSSGDPATYTVEVERVFKGVVRPTVHVLSADSGASCGLEAEEGRRYMVFADRTRGELWAGLCGGTATADPQLVAEVEEAAGPPRDPDPRAEPTVRPTAGAGLAVPLAAASGLGLVLLGGVLWLRLLLRR